MTSATSQTISVTRALVELKRLDSRIESAINNGTFIARTVGRGTNMKLADSHESLIEAATKIQGSYDQVDQFILNREKIKSAIVMSNASTKVKILGREVTVAEAIELKNTVKFRTMYLDTLKTQLQSVRSVVKKNNAALDLEIETSLNTLYGTDAKKIDSDTIKSVSDLKKDQKESSFLYGDKISTKISKIEEDILNLSSELDFVLSESNAKSTITVEM